MQTKNFKIGQNFKELTEHRTTVLPIACYRTTIRQNLNGYIPMHWHEEFQFVVIMKGQAIFQIQDEKVKLDVGDGIFINSGCLHLAKDDNHSQCEYICLNVSPSFVLSQELFRTYVYPYIEATNLSYIILSARESWAKNILDAILEIDRLIDQSPALYEIDITMQLTHIWRSLVVSGFKLEYKEADMLKNHRMKQMLHWIHNHFAEKIILEDIARAGQLSRSECCRYFKRFLKKTPMNYLMEYRIQKSLILLQQPEYNITDVAYQIGFNSTSYFIGQFRKSMNMTPLAYKKQKKITYYT
ncbi:AraC family transcriptional regulator [Paenibacillus sp. VTT E-133280]|jgi:AraC-like DNA-binding protein/mannose-6-phosphate isomerase-like protein (cupin superfamily)|uniref:helix-turn-helix domain-containing protein n=1 Tax=Paenibacillus sp. VTT E-133280 TaxID=1986222 RepID=UPI000B9FEDD0|nr:helix-turn-helix domain-containing protein [Paenibacillus sp. VTT E-133280]OZQ63322.1 AraC family transcriptional regulator [Paenibacillus sp. VTT E-133280]